MNKKNLPIYKITINADDESGVSKISLVDAPAIEVNWLAFNEHKNLYKFEKASDEQTLAGPFLIPDLPIYRMDEKLGEYYVVFEKETIKQIAKKFNKESRNSSINKDHLTDVKDAYVLENWLVKDTKNDKSNTYGYELPEGSWFGLIQIEDEKFWNEFIKSGELKGFSVEGLMGLSFSIQPEEETKEIQSVIPDDLVELVLAHLDIVGEKQTEEDEEWDLMYTQDVNLEDLDKPDESFIQLAITSNPEQKSSEDAGLYKIRYRFNGPRDDKNRTFCASVLDRNLVYRKEDINQMSFRTENKEFGTYSIFRFKGSYNCRHNWTRLIYFRKRNKEGRFLPNEGLNNDQITTTESGVDEPTSVNKPVQMKKMKFESIEIKDGSVLSAEAIEVGAEVFIMNPETNEKTSAPDGEYITADGFTITVAEGKIEAILEPVAEEEEVEAAEEIEEEVVEAAEEVIEEEAPVEEEATDEVGELRNMVAELLNRITNLEERIAGMEPTEEELKEEKFTRVDIIDSITKKNDKKEFTKETTSDVIYRIQELKRKK